MSWQLNPKRWRRFAAIVAILVVAAVVALPWLMRGIGHWLVLEEPLRPAAAIFVHAGAIPFRELEAANLYRQGVAPEIWLAPVKPSNETQALRELGIVMPAGAELRVMILEHSGVPSDAIRILDGNVFNTRDEIRSAEAEARRRGADTIVLISSKAHTRRLRWLWDRLAAGSPVSAIVRPATRDPFHPGEWWRNTDDGQQVVHELAALVDTLFDTGLRPAR